MELVIYFLLGPLEVVKTAWFKELSPQATHIDLLDYSAYV